MRFVTAEWRTSRPKSVARFLRAGLLNVDFNINDLDLASSSTRQAQWAGRDTDLQHISLGAEIPLILEHSWFDCLTTIAALSSNSYVV